MKLLFYIVFVLLSIFSLNFVLNTYEGSSIFEFGIMVFFYLILFFVAVNFKANAFINLLDFRFILDSNLFIIGLIGVIGIFLIGLSAKGIQIKLNPNKITDLSDASFLVIIVMAFNVFFEEVLIRKYLITQITKKYTPFNAICISASIFAIGHLMVGEGLLLLFFLGLMLGYVYWISKNWLLCFIIHFLYNCLIYFVDGLIIHGANILHLNIYIYLSFLLIGIVLLFFIFSKLKKRLKLLNL